MAEPISLNDFRKMFDTDSEFAVIDSRQTSDFSQGHILAASSLSLAQLEQMIGPAVPKRDTPCVLCDAGARFIPGTWQIIPGFYTSVLAEVWSCFSSLISADINIDRKSVV
jgi:hypothetical protein